MNERDYRSDLAKRYRTTRAVYKMHINNNHGSPFFLQRKFAVIYVWKCVALEEDQTPHLPGEINDC